MEAYLHTDHQQIFELSKEELNVYDVDLFDFLLEWKSENTHIQSTTSGSTGTPKTIKLSKSSMLVSAKATNEYFNLNDLSSYFICLPVKYIAGKMMLARAFQGKGKIILAKANAIPVKALKENVSFCAMTPYQAMHSIKEHKAEMNLIDQLIIGGSPVNSDLAKELNNLKTACYVTFGMTETISHIALKPIENTIYECLPHVSISSNDNQQLIIDAPEIDVHKLVTNDIISHTDEKHFKWIGRSDNVINSGGIKLHPELIEEKLEKVLKDVLFFIDQIPHLELGSQPVLIIEEKALDEVIAKGIDLLEKFEIPKKIYKTERFFFAGNNKIDRSKTKKAVIGKYR